MLHSPYMLLIILPLIVFLACYVIYYYGEGPKTLKQLNILDGPECRLLNECYGSWWIVIKEIRGHWNTKKEEVIEMYARRITNWYPYKKDVTQKGLYNVLTELLKIK